MMVTISSKLDMLTFEDIVTINSGKLRVSIPPYALVLWLASSAFLDQWQIQTSRNELTSDGTSFQKPRVNNNNNNNNTVYLFHAISPNARST